MEQDALRAGVAPGGLLSTAEVRILICYILSTAQEPVPGKRLAELLHYEGLANYFEVEEGIHALLEQRQISAADEPDAYCITPSGRDAAETLRRGGLPPQLHLRPQHGCSPAADTSGRPKSKSSRRAPDGSSPAR